MFKRYSPSTIALLLGLLSFLLVLLTSYLVFGQLLYSAVVAIIVFIFIYSIVLYYITQILDKKINTIYKLINQTKAGKREQFYNNEILPRPTLDELTNDVEKWTNENSNNFELLEKNEQYRKEFLQNLSHELKTPIYAMQGYLETLLDGALHDSNVNQKYLQNSVNNLERLTELVKDLDIITKIEKHPNNINKSTFVLNEILEQTISDFNMLAKDRNIKIQISDVALKNIKVKADKLKIKQVLDNLIENAIKYSKSDGSIVINAELLNNNTVIVEVSDKGFGIAEEHLNRIFERFYRTDEARSRNIGGSGLGLAICKHIIEAHEQNIYVRSNINVGTTVRFTLQKD